MADFKVPGTISSDEAIEGIRRLVHALAESAADNVKLNAHERMNKVYPTWKQWHEKTFPDRAENENSTIYPCLFMSEDDLNCANTSCEECRNRRIPADVAEKLGIKPGEEWE